MNFTDLSKSTLIDIILDLANLVENLESNLNGHRKALSAETTAKLKHYDTIKNLERKLEEEEYLNRAKQDAIDNLNNDLAKLRTEMKNTVPKYTGDTASWYFSQDVAPPGRKIQAIKLMRLELGLSLKEAKEYVEGYGTYDIKADHATHIMARLDELDTGYPLLRHLDDDLEDNF